MVTRGLHVRDALWRDTVLCRVAGGDVRQDHEPRGTVSVLYCVTQAVGFAINLCPVS